jgi:hypothetical protein
MLTLRQDSSGSTGLIPVAPVVDGADGWEGSLHDAVCPGCQLAEWVPLCQSLVDKDGELVDLTRPRGRGARPHVWKTRPRRRLPGKRSATASGC